MKPIRIYDLNHYGLTEEELAVVMAKCARSPEPFDEIAKTVTEAGAEQFHEKYVLGYGHASVAEIAVPNFAFEGVSILASKILESMQRGAYQEKSTRAQNFLFKDEDGHYTGYYIPPGFEDNGRHYIESMDYLFSAYEEMMPVMQEWAHKQETGDDIDKGTYPYKIGFAAQRRAFDSLRYLLPIGTQTNLGMRLNARDTAVLITKLLSSPWEEFKRLGVTLKDIARAQLPTLVRHADLNPFLVYQQSIGRDIAAAVHTEDDLLAPPDYLNQSYCEVVGAPDRTDAVRRVARAFLVGNGNSSYMLYPKEVVDQCGQLIIDMIMNQRGEHDPFPDEFDAVPLTVEMVMDYGAYRDLQRHRYCTQHPQRPTLNLGYEIPEDILDAGLGDKFHAVMSQARINASLFDPDDLSAAHLYLIPLAYRHRMLVEMTLKEAAYLIELRTKPQGHISYRRIAKTLHDCLMERMPSLAKYISCHPVP